MGVVKITTEHLSLHMNFHKMNSCPIATLVVSSTQVFPNIGPGMLPQVGAFHMDLDFQRVLERADPSSLLERSCDSR